MGVHVHRMSGYGDHHICRDCGERICPLTGPNGVGCGLTEGHDGPHFHNWSETKWRTERPVEQKLQAVEQ